MYLFLKEILVKKYITILISKLYYYCRKVISTQFKYQLYLHETDNWDRVLFGYHSDLQISVWHVYRSSCYMSHLWLFWLRICPKNLAYYCIRLLHLRRVPRRIIVIFQMTKNEINFMTLKFDIFLEI